MGGAENAIIQLLEQIGDTHMIVTHVDGMRAEEAKSLADRYTLLTKRRFCGLLEALSEVEVVHIHTINDHPLIPLAAQLSGAPTIVQTVHNHFSPKYCNFVDHSIVVGLELLDRVVTPGRTTAEVEYLSVVPFFDVKETYVLDGMTRTKNSRRDMEAGMSTCTATLVNDIEDASTGESYVLRIRMSWEEPNRGGLVEEMHVATTGELVVMSTVQVGDGTATCRTVYDKVGEGGLRFNARWNPLDAVRIMGGGKV